MSEGRISPWVPTELRWLVEKIRPRLNLHLGSCLCIACGSALALLTPLVLKWVIDLVIPHHRVGLLFMAMALIFLGSQVSGVI
jgi:ABC-type bacteriocin/lantibiotic exporter with double-glycine peptidase domain